MYKLTSPGIFDTEFLGDFFDEGHVGLHVSRDGLGLHVTDEAMSALEQAGFTGERMRPMPLIPKKERSSKWRDWCIIQIVVIICTLANVIGMCKLPRRFN